MSRADRARARYPGGRPTAETRGIQARFMRVAGRGLFPGSAVLETRGRSSGLPRRVPVAVARYRGARYLVSMLGADVDWIRNARADDWQAVLVHGRREPVRLVEVPVAERAPVIKRYLVLAWGARPHIPVRWTAPVREFEAIAADYPVFRVDSS